MHKKYRVGVAIVTEVDGPADPELYPNAQPGQLATSIEREVIFTDGCSTVNEMNMRGSAIIERVAAFFDDTLTDKRR